MTGPEHHLRGTSAQGTAGGVVEFALFLSHEQFLILERVADSERTTIADLLRRTIAEFLARQRAIPPGHRASGGNRHGGCFTGNRHGREALHRPSALTQRAS
jgi:hypothetical protein